MPIYNMNDRELATVLGALRAAQWSGLKLEHYHIATNGGTLRPLDEQEIDALCERFNTAPTPTLYVVIEGGSPQIVSDYPAAVAASINVITIDYDTEGANEEDLRPVEQSDGSTVMAFVSDQSIRLASIKPGKLNSLFFGGSDFMLEADELTDDLRNDLIDCGGPDDATEAVEHVMRTYSIHGDEETCRSYLRGYGAWTDEELADHEENLRRLVWQAGCALYEGEGIYFSAY